MTCNLCFAPWQLLLLSITLLSQRKLIVTAEFDDRGCDPLLDSLSTPMTLSKSRANYFYTVTDAIPVVVDVLSWEHKERVRTIAFGDVLS
jgi:hypothetical protein